MTLSEYHELVEATRLWLSRRQGCPIGLWEAMNTASILIGRTLHLALLMAAVDEPLGIRPYTVPHWNIS